MGGGEGSMEMGNQENVDVGMGPGGISLLSRGRRILNGKGREGAGDNNNKPFDGGRAQVDVLFPRCPSST